MPLDIALFEFVHNARKRGKALLETLITPLLMPPPRNAA
jgi:hypothetical protein